MNEEERKELLEQINRVEIRIIKTLDKIKTLRKRIKSEVLEK